MTRGQAFEVVGPYLFGFVAAWIVAGIARKVPIPTNIKDVFMAVTGTAGVLAGFMLATASILASIGDRPYIRSARRAGVYSWLIDDLFAAMRWCIFATVLSLPGLLYDPSWKLTWYPYALWLWAMTSFTALGLSARALQTFAKFMKYVARD